MWMGKRVQRAARKTHLPKQVGLWQGEPTSYEGAHATESAPQRTVEVGGRSPGAKAKRGYPMGGSVVQTDGAAAPQDGNVARPFASQPAQRVAALCKAPPRTGFIRPLEKRSDERQVEMCRCGVQPHQYWEVTAR